MDFTAIVLFLSFYYIRPQEIFDILSSLRPVSLSMAMGIIGIAMRNKDFHIRDLFQTPHDWIMYALLGWIVYASPDSWSAWADIKTYLVFYAVIVLTLTTVKRLYLFLFWWTILILLLAFVAVISMYGIDPLGNMDWTIMNQGRLCVDLSIFRNPNALGHNIVPGLMLAYFAFMWGRPIFMQQMGAFILLLPAYCIYLTVSKGAFVSGFFTGITSFIFGRHLVVQGLAIAAAVSVGWGALFMLPRMGALQRNPSSDPGIAQRILLWKRGLDIMRYEDKGVGYMHWWASMYRDMGWMKAPHCTYVQVGAELGYKGFYLYLAVLYCCLRTLVFARTANKEEERIRRMLFVLVIAYTVSSWLIDFGYRPTYFMFAACCAAFHRILHFRGQTVEVEAEEPQLVTGMKAATPGGSTLPMPAMAVMMSAAQPSPVVPTPKASTQSRKTPDDDEESNENPPQGIKWKRFGLIDFALVYVMMKAFERFWVYAIGNM